MIDGFRYLLAILWNVEPEDIEVEKKEADDEREYRQGPDL